MSSLALVTGAAGFVGRPLCETLRQRGYRVRALLRGEPQTGPWDEVLLCDLPADDLPAPLMKGVDTVFHLAGVAHALKPVPGMEKLYFQVNVEGTRRLVEQACRDGVRALVYVSSVKAMADPGEDCVDESWEAEPHDAYGLSKRRAEALVLEAGRGCGLHVSCLRPALVYGPGVKGNLERMIRAVAGNRFPPLEETNNRRSLVHVRDLAEAAILAAERPEANGQAYIVTDGATYSTRSMYEGMLRALGKKVPDWTFQSRWLRFLARLGDGAGWVMRRRMPFDSEAFAKMSGSACYRSDKIMRELGFRPTRNLMDSIPEMVHSVVRAR